LNVVAPFLFCFIPFAFIFYRIVLLMNNIADSYKNRMEQPILDTNAGKQLS